MPPKKPQKRKNQKFEWLNLDWFEKDTKSKAEEYASDPERTQRLIDDAFKKAQETGGKKGPLSEVWDYLMAMFRLLGGYVNREYKQVSWETIALIVPALIYFLSPIDFLPDGRRTSR